MDVLLHGMSFFEGGGEPSLNQLHPGPVDMVGS